MQKPDTQRVREINDRLIYLYQLSDQPELSLDDESQIQAEILLLETKLSQLATPVVQDDKLSQYVEILVNAARTLQLYRQTLHEFRTKPTIQQTPDDIRQKNIALNKFRLAEKKVKSYRSKLGDLGLQPFEIDDIVLRGYRQHNQRIAKGLLHRLEYSLLDYILDAFDTTTTLPDDVLIQTRQWLNGEKRAHLNSLQLQVADAYKDCMDNGIPSHEIDLVIQNTLNWDNKVQQQKLLRFQADLIAELGKLDDYSIFVNQWIEQYDNHSKMTPQQVKIIRQLKNLLLHGVSHKEIDRILKIPVGNKHNGLFAKFRNRHRDS